MKQTNDLSPNLISISRSPILRILLLVSLGLLIVLSGCAPAEPEDKRCNEEQFWDGQNCISKNTTIDTCIDLSEPQKQLCQAIIQTRIRFYEQLEIVESEKEPNRQQIVNEIQNTADFLSRYRDINVKILCNVRNNDVECAEISSIIAFYDNKVLEMILEDLLQLQSGRNDETGDILLNCGNGVMGLANSQEQETNGLDPGVEREGGVDREQDYPSWFAEFFSEDTDDQLVDLCARLSAGALGSGGAGILGLVPIGSEQCEAFAIDTIYDSFNEFAGAVTKAMENGLDTCSTNLPIEGVLEPGAPPTHIETLEEMIRRTTSDINQEGTETEGEGGTKTEGGGNETTQHFTNETLEAQIQEGTIQRSDGVKGTYKQGVIIGGGKIVLDKTIQWDDGKSYYQADSYTIESIDGNSGVIETSFESTIAEVFFENPGLGEPIHMLQTNDYDQADYENGTQVRYFNDGSKTWLRGNGTLYYYPPGSNEGQRVTPQGDCIEEICQACNEFINVFISDADECLLSRDRSSSSCESIRKATECCTSQSDALTDPRIILPNPDGYACYAQLSPEAARNQFCKDKCSLAQDTNCEEQCRLVAHPVLQFELMDNACQYMISEECFSSGILNNTPKLVGAEGLPPFPFSLNENTFIPDILQEEETEVDR